MMEQMVRYCPPCNETTMFVNFTYSFDYLLEILKCGCALLIAADWFCRSVFDICHELRSKLAVRAPVCF